MLDKLLPPPLDGHTISCIVFDTVCVIELNRKVSPAVSANACSIEFPPGVCLAGQIDDCLLDFLSVSVSSRIRSHGEV
jgi:hypothetical protein